MCIEIVKILFCLLVYLFFNKVIIILCKYDLYVKIISYVSYKCLLDLKFVLSGFLFRLYI